jgi:transcriptional regulator with XRE-family HTH domain
VFDNKIFSKKLIELRKQHNLSQLQLGKIVGLTQTAISMIEKAERAASIEVLDKLADYFGVSIDYLVGRSDVR